MGVANTPASTGNSLWQTRTGRSARPRLLRGHRSSVISEEDARALVQTLPCARFVDIKDAGHMFAGDANDAFAASVAAFFHEAMPPAQPPASGTRSRSME
jgi:pimeloyl-ACP methyl ester carboxylesterase